MINTLEQFFFFKKLQHYWHKEMWDPILFYYVISSWREIGLFLVWNLLFDSGCHKDIMICKGYTNGLQCYSHRHLGRKKDISWKGGQWCYKGQLFLCCLVLLWPFTIEHSNSTMSCPIVNSCEDCQPLFSSTASVSFSCSLCFTSSLAKIS